MGYININTVQTTFYWPFQPKQRQILKFWLKKFFLPQSYKEMFGWHSRMLKKHKYRVVLMTELNSTYLKQWVNAHSKKNSVNTFYTFNKNPTNYQIQPLAASDIINLLHANGLSIPLETLSFHGVWKKTSGMKQVHYSITSKF